MSFEIARQQLRDQFNQIGGGFIPEQRTEASEIIKSQLSAKKPEEEAQMGLLASGAKKLKDFTAERKEANPLENFGYGLTVAPRIIWGATKMAGTMFKWINQAGARGLFQLYGGVEKARGLWDPEGVRDVRLTPEQIDKATTGDSIMNKIARFYFDEEAKDRYKPFDEIITESTTMGMDLGMTQKEAKSLSTLGYGFLLMTDLTGLGGGTSGVRHKIYKGLLKKMEKETGGKITGRVLKELASEATRISKITDKALKASEFEATFKKLLPLVEDASKPTKYVADAGTTRLNTIIRSKAITNITQNPKFVSLTERLRTAKTAVGEASARAVENLYPTARAVRGVVADTPEKARTMLKQGDTSFFNITKSGKVIDTVGLDGNPQIIDKKGSKFWLAEDLAEETAGNIRLDKITTVDEVKNVIKQTFREQSNLIDAQRRGVITHQKTKELADLLGITPEKLAKVRKGTSANAEELVASVDLLKTSAKQVIRAQKAYKIAPSEYNLVKLRTYIQKHGEIQKVVAGLKAESGRALQANKILAREVPTEQRALEAVMDTLGGKGHNEELARLLGNLDLEDTLAVNKFIRDHSKAKTMDQLYELWINSILANPLTHIVNSGSNLVKSLMQIPERFGMAVFSKEVRFMETVAVSKGLIEGLGEGFRRAVHVFKNGVTLEEASKIEMRIPAIRGKAGEIVRAPTRALMAEDEFFKVLNGTAELYAQAYRLGKAENLKGRALRVRIAELISNPTEEMLKEIQASKLYTTFQTELGHAGRTIMNARINIPGVRWVIPFIKTPTNIAKDAIKMSPAGFPLVFYKILKGKYPKQITAEMGRDITKATIGSLLATGVAFKAVEGTITGRAPRGAEGDAFYRSGKQPYSIRIGDTWYSYRRIEPFATLFGLVADVIQDAKEGKNVGQMAKEIAFTFARNMNDKTFMSGLSNALNAMTDPDRYAEQFVSQLGSGFVPFSGTLSWMARIQSQTIRDPEGIKEKIMSRLPYLQHKIVPKRNVWGETIKREGGKAVQAFSPVYITKERNDEVDKMLRDLGTTVGFPSKSITIPKATADQLGLTDEQRRFNLTNEEYDVLLEATGKASYEHIKKLMATDGFKKADEATKIKYINSIVSDVRTDVRFKMLEKILGGETFKYEDPELSEKKGTSFLMAGALMAGAVGLKKVNPVAYNGLKEISTKIMKDESLIGKTVVKKSHLESLLKQKGIKPAEHNLITGLLKEEGDQVNMNEFAEKVKTNLLPLEQTELRGTTFDSSELVAQYSSVTLPSTVMDTYVETVYRMPYSNNINHHFDDLAGAETIWNYFAHTRHDSFDVKNIVDGREVIDKIYRVQELQSDLYQHYTMADISTHLLAQLEDNKLTDKAMEKLNPYEKGWWKRIIREEAKKASATGHTKFQIVDGTSAGVVQGFNVQFPNGKVSPNELTFLNNLSHGEQFSMPTPTGHTIEYINVKPFGREGVIQGEALDELWIAPAHAIDDEVNAIVADPLMDRGILEAYSAFSKIPVEKMTYDSLGLSMNFENWLYDEYFIKGDRLRDYLPPESIVAIDRDGLVIREAEQAGLYHFYQKSIADELKKFRGKDNVKHVIGNDGHGVWEFDLSPADADDPVLAYGKYAIPMGLGGGLTGSGLYGMEKGGGEGDIKEKDIQTPVEKFDVNTGETDKISKAEYDQRVKEAEEDMANNPPKPKPESESEPKPKPKPESEPKSEEKQKDMKIASVPEKPVAEKKSTTTVQFQTFVPEPYKDTIADAGKEYQVDPKLISAIINTENRGWKEEVKNAQEGSTATGLGQITRATEIEIEKGFGPFDRKDGNQSIKAIAYWIDQIRKRIGSDDPAEIANAYNQGITGHTIGRRNQAYTDTVKKFLD